MRYVVSVWAFGLLCGIVLTLVSVGLSAGWYEYGWAPGVTFSNPGADSCTTSIYADVVRSGWEVVPNQPDRCYVRRPRFRLH